MRYSFNVGSGKSSFGSLKEPIESGCYTYNLKAKTTFCVGNNCIPSRTVDTQSNLLLLKRSNRLSYYPKKNAFNYANLNVNLISKLNVKDVCVIKNMHTKDCPTTISVVPIPSLTYDIDPSGNLFGETTCGLNNFTNYVEMYDDMNYENKQM